MTQTGAIVGTVQYLSPEQAEGHPVDRRSDLYSAGIVLYELLTGQVAVRRRGADLDRAQADQRAPGAAAASSSPGIPPALEAVVMRALEKDPARRYQSAEEFIAALEQARRAPDAPDRDGADARRAVGRRGAGARAGGSGRWSRSRWPRSASAPTSCSSATRSTVPNLVGREAERGRPDPAATAGSRSQFVDARVRRRAARRGDLAGPRGGRGGARGHDRDRDDLRRARAGAGARRRGRIAARTPSRRSRTPGFKAKVEEAFSDAVPEGDVISASPAGGKQATKGRTVTMTVSQGPEGIAVPKRRRAAARRGRGAELEAAGLQRRGDRAGDDAAGRAP